MLAGKLLVFSSLLYKKIYGIIQEKLHFHHFWEFKGVKSYNYSKLQLSPPANRVSRSLLSLVASNSIKLVDNRSPESLRAF